MKQVHAGSRTIAVSVLLLFGLTIGVSMMTGWWHTESRKVPARIAEGDFAGEFDPGDIRGSYTFSDIEEAFGIPVEHLAEAYAFAVTGDPSSVQPKLFEEFPQPEEGEIGTDSLRLFVSLYKGIPYEPEEDTKLPNSALAVLKREGIIDEARRSELKDRYGVEMESVSDDETGAQTDEVPASPVLEIKGKTTFGELYDAGLTAGEVNGILGMEPGGASESVRDFLAAAGLEFSVYRALLQEALEKQSQGE